MLGDHIRALKNGRWLHGIDLGDQRILFLDETAGLPPADRLRRVYRPDFTAGASRVEAVVHRERTYPAKAAVARAWSRFMDPSVVAMFRDSEQFAAWCKVGRVPETAPAAPPVAPRSAATKAAPPKVKAQAKPAAKAAPVKTPAPKAAPAKAAKPKAKAKAKPARKAAPSKKVARKAAPRKKAAPKKTATAAKRKASPPAKRKAAKPAKKGKR